MRTRAGEPSGGQPARRLDAVDVRHPDVHQDHVRVAACARARPPRGRPPPRRPPRGPRASRGSAGSRCGRAPGRRPAGRGCSRSLDGDPRPHREPAAGRGPGGQVAAELGGALAHADDAVAGRDGRRALPVVDDLDLQRAAGRRTSTRAVVARACLSVLVSASCTIRYAERSTLGGSDAGSRSIDSSTARPAERTRSASAPRLSEAGGGGEASRSRRPAGGAARRAPRGRSTRSRAAPRGPRRAGCRTRRRRPRPGWSSRSRCGR